MNKNTAFKIAKQFDTYLNIILVQTGSIRRRRSERIIRNSKFPTDCKIKITEKDNLTIRV